MTAEADGPSNHPATGGPRLDGMPAVALGTWPLAGRDCRRIVAEAIELGYRHVDTAQTYANEAEVGRGLADAGLRRAEMFLTTKLWPDSLAAEAVGPAIERSLDRLGTDHVDLLLIHWPNPAVPVAETLAAMDAARRAGKAKRLGISNFTPALIAEALATGVPLHCNQVEFHPFIDQRRLHAATRAAGLYLVAYSPLARGAAARDPVLAEIGRRHGATGSQVALAWILAHDGTGFAAKASSRARLSENLAAASLVLAPDEIAAIDRLARGTRIVNPAHAPD